jgi:dihydroorotate dehydrogenase (fumarate)
MGALHAIDAHAGSHPEAQSYFPDTNVFALGPAEYLEQIRRIKAAVAVPVIASLNGATEGGWLDFSRRIVEAGADALELNAYYLATDPAEDALAVERRVVDMLRAVKAQVAIPVAVKLSPFFSALAHFAGRLEGAGADGLVLFNRFYQPDIDVELLEVDRTLRLSDSSELPLRLRWLAILSGRGRVSLAASGGVHTPIDAVKAVMCGAHAVQLVAHLLVHGPEQLGAMRTAIAEWLEAHEYESLAQMQGSMSLERCPDPRAYERTNYMEMLQRWR